MSSELEIRLAGREDLPAIIQLLARDSLLNPPPQAGPTGEQAKAFEIIHSDPNNQIVVATLHEEVIGTLQLTFIPGLSHKGVWRAQVEAVRVREDLRNRQIGTRLMEWVVERARERGCWLIQLTSNRARLDAHRFYERLGFTASHVGMKLYLDQK
jgi:GNAT superfamily N-acetyltransferase